MDPISDNLIHFLGRSKMGSPREQFEIFKSIINNGLRTGKTRIEFPGTGLITNKIVCFTDLPLRYCDRHSAIYGKFGIGFKKSFVKNAGGNPAMYFVNATPSETNDSSLIESRGAAALHFGQIQKFIVDLKNAKADSRTPKLVDENNEVLKSPEELDVLESSIIYALSFLKEIGDLGPARDESPDIDVFYHEREWRLVPSKLDLINNGVEFDPVAEIGHYKFKCSDLNMIIVPNDDLVNDVSEFLKSLKDNEDSRLMEFSHNMPPILSYDQLQKW